VQKSGLAPFQGFIDVIKGPTFGVRQACETPDPEKL
jgi:hypothetical protein